MHDAPLAVIVGGDVPTRTMLRYLLEDTGCTVIDAATAAAMAVPVRRSDVALLVVIADSTGHDDIGTLAALHRAGYHAPTVLLAHGAGLELRRRAFALGVVDVVSLPADTRDLQARLRFALGDRVPARKPAAAEIVRAGGLTLDTVARTVTDDTGWRVRLTQREASLLQALMAAPGQLVEHTELLSRIWGARDAGDLNTLAVYVSRLRTKLTRPCAPHGYVRTVRGRGYTFDARGRPRPPQQAEPGGPPCVLVVDDDPAITGLIGEVLQRAGYTVAHGVGMEAPALARRLQPAVILLDLMMPGMDGVEVRRRLRTEPRTARIPVIALSAGRNLRAHAAELGADDYLAKPFDLDELLLRIEKWAGPGLPAAAPISTTVSETPAEQGGRGVVE